MKPTEPPIICIFCGHDVSNQGRRIIPVSSIEFRPWIGQPDGEPGRDTLTGMKCCQECYTNILANRAKAVFELGRLPKEE